MTNLNNVQDSCTGPEDLFIEPVYAIRAFRTSQHFKGLSSISRYFMWQPGQTHHAKCNRQETLEVYLSWTMMPIEEHSAPVQDCTCGFYAWNVHSVSTVIRENLIYGYAPGIVALTGRILVGERGYRAEKARIVALGLPGKAVGMWSVDVPVVPLPEEWQKAVPVFKTVTEMLRAFPLSKIGIKSSALDDIEEAS